MIRKTAASLLEVVHLATLALLLTMSVCVATIPGPLRAWKGSAFAATGAESVSGAFQDYLLARGPWLAGIALFAAAAAGFLRGDSKKFLPLVRLVGAGSMLLFALWAASDLRPHRLPTAWNCLFVACASDVVVTAFLVTPGKGGGRSSSASKKDG